MSQFQENQTSSDEKMMTRQVGQPQVDSGYIFFPFQFLLGESLYCLLLHFLRKQEKEREMSFCSVLAMVQNNSQTSNIHLSGSTVFMHLPGMLRALART